MDKELQDASAKLTYKSGDGFLSANVTYAKRFKPRV